MNIANAVVRIIDAHAGVVSRSYNDSLWKIAETSAAGATTTFEYDQRGNQTKRVFANGATYTMAYNAEDQIIDGVDPIGVRTTWTYDFRSRLVNHATSIGEWVQIEHGPIYPSRIHRSDGTSVAFEHDQFGQLTAITLPDGSRQERSYNRQGRLTAYRDAAGRTYSFEYDLEGRLVRVGHPGGGASAYTYSPEGDVLSESAPFRLETFGYSGYHQLAWREEAGERIELRRDSEDDLIAVVNEKGEEYTLEYDACRRVKAETTFEGRTQSFVRDAAGNVTAIFLPDKSMIACELDVFGNPTWVMYPDGQHEAFAYDLLGNLESASNAAGTIRFERDGRRRVVKEYFGDEWVTSKYDPLGRSIELTSSKRLSQRIARGPLGHVQAIGLWERGADQSLHPIWHVAFERDARGDETRRRAGAVEVLSRRDERGRQISRTTTRGGDLIEQVSFDWAGLDRLVSRNDSLVGKTEYTHDARGRLVAAQGPSGSTTWRAPDTTGNLFKREDRSDRRYGKGGVLLEADGITYAYDALGNVSEKRLPDGRCWKYTWSSAGFLTKVTRPDGREISFEYDPLGRRTSKTVDGKTTRWLWSGDTPIHEWTESADESGTLTTWVFEPDGFSPVGRVTSAGEHSTIITDYLGTPERMYDAAGRRAWKAQLDIYGIPTNVEGRRQPAHGDGLGSMRMKRPGSTTTAFAITIRSAATTSARIPRISGALYRERHSIRTRTIRSCGLMFSGYRESYTGASCAMRPARLFAIT